MTETLRRAGLVPDGALGPAADGVRRRVRDADGAAWAVTVVPADRADAARERVARLREVDHPHVATPARCVELSDGSLAVLQPEVPGADLTTLRGSRGAWPPGEVVTIVVPLAEALAALHGAGLAHGDVAPGNVVLRSDGRPVLVDVVRGAEPTELGTPLTAAPERDGGATPAADVYALGRLGLVLLGGATDGGDAGLGALARALRAACAAEPAERPPAGELALQVYAACAPAPVRPPDPAVLARLSVRRLARADEAPETLRREGAGGGRPSTARARAGGRHRQPAGRRIGTRVVTVAAGAALAAVGVLAVVADGGAAWPRAGEARADGPVARDAVAAAVRLTQVRADALGRGRPGALTALTVPGSQAWRADRRAGALAVARGPVEGAGLRVLGGGRMAAPWCRRPGAVDASTPARAGESCAPAVQVRVATETVRPGAPASRDVVVLVLVRWGGAWRVSSVAAAP